MKTAFFKYQSVLESTALRAVLLILLLPAMVFAVTPSVYKVSELDTQKISDSIDTAINTSPLTISPMRPEGRDFIFPPGSAKLYLKRMFSSQTGSWPFEPFVRNGLFVMNASYQTTHPKAVFLSKGTLTLDQLYEKMADDKIIRPYNDGYLLSYPMIVDVDGGLEIKDQALYLNTSSGAAIINMGKLSIENSLITTKEVLEPQEDDALLQSYTKFRPFITSWAGSYTYINQSELRHLGYEGHLAGGLTVIKSKYQNGSYNTFMTILSSNFKDLYVGTKAQHAIVKIHGNTYSKLGRYGIELHESEYNIVDNSIEGVAIRDGIRLGGFSRGNIESNVVRYAGQSAIRMEKVIGAISVHKNSLSDNQSHGLHIKSSLYHDRNRITVTQNDISNNHQNGVDGLDLLSSYIVNNRIHSNKKHGVNLVYSNYPRHNSVVLSGNNLAINRKSAIRTKNINHLVFGDNLFRGLPPYQEFISGDLLPIQSVIMDKVVRNKRILEITRK